jgi:hypothetical protein
VYTVGCVDLEALIAVIIHPQFHKHQQGSNAVQAHPISVGLHHWNTWISQFQM